MRIAELALTALALSALAACHDSGAAVTSCQDSLSGTWVRERSPGERLGGEDARPEREERWAILDRGARLEIYPLFDDTAANVSDDARLLRVRSPRSLELLRSHSVLLGHVERWVMRRGTKCRIRGSARISRCRSDVRGAVLEAQLVELPMPASEEELATCGPAPGGLPRQALRWRRVE